MESREGGLTEDAVGLVSAAPDWPLAGILLGLDLVPVKRVKQPKLVFVCKTLLQR